MSRELDISYIDARLARRRRVRRALVAVGLVIVVLIVCDQVGLLGATGNDWSRFDKKFFPFVRATSGDEIVVQQEGVEVPVRLMGVDAPDIGLVGNSEATEYVSKRLQGRKVTLRLESTQTRDAERNLLAYVYVADNDNLNQDIIRDGKAYADRRFKHTLAGQFEQAESEARKKSRGIWDGLRTEDQPAWRQEWLKGFLAERRATTQRSAK
jgi:endonuclease YncB( thermonuclease family)